MITLEDLYSLLEGSFDYLMVLDENRRVKYLNSTLKDVCFPDGEVQDEPGLDKLVDGESLRSLKKAMKKVKGGGRGVPGVFSPAGGGLPGIPVRVGYTEGDEGGLFLVTGMQADTLRQMDDWEREERAKELACLYSVAEWIEVSETIHDSSRSSPLPRRRYALPRRGRCLFSLPGYPIRH